MRTESPAIPATTLTLRSPERFADRHNGPDEAQRRAMLEALGLRSLDELVDATVPASIRLRRSLALPSAKSEQALLETLETIAARNKVFRSFIGMGYSDCITPPVILRNVIQS